MMMDELLDLDNPNLTHFTTQRRSFPFLSCTMADRFNFRIRRVDGSGIITTVAGNGTFGFAGDGGAATAASLAFPSGVYVDGSDNLFIADRDNHRIRRVDSSGTITTVAGDGVPSFAGDGGTAVDASLNRPSGVYGDSAGGFYVADTNNRRIRKVAAPIRETTPASGLSGAMAVAPGEESPIFSIGITGDGTSSVDAVSLTLSDLSSGTGLAQSDFLQLQIYQSDDAVLDGGDSQIGTLSQSSIQIGFPVTLLIGASSIPPIGTEWFYIVSAEMNTILTDGHAFKVGFAPGGVTTSWGDVGSAVAASDNDRATLDAVATQLVFTVQPGGSANGLPLTLQPVVTALDANGNMDLGFSEVVTLTESSPGSLVNSSMSAVSGVAAFTTLIYTATVDQEVFALTADDEFGGPEGDLPPVTSSSIVCDVVATQLVFTVEPAVSVSGQALGTQPVVVAQDASGQVDTGFNEIVTLTHGSSGSLTNHTQVAASGVATFTNLTYTATADGETFGLTADDQAGGVEGDLPGVTSVGLSSDVVATQLLFAVQPAGSVSGQALTTQPVVVALDGGGLVDLDFVETVTLTTGAPGSLTGQSVSAMSGVAAFVNLTYRAVADGETLSLTADDVAGGVEGDLPAVTSVGVPSDVVATQLVFAVQPAGSMSGQVLTTQPVVVAQDGDGVVDVNFAETVALTTGGAGVLLNFIKAAVSGVATFTDLTYTATADGETFNLTADDAAGGVEGDLPAVTSAEVSSDVVATQLVFAVQPAGSVSGQVLTTQPVVVAQNGSGQVDLDFTETVTLTTGAPGSLTGHSVSAMSGVAAFANLTYRVVADGETFTLTADDAAGGVEGDLPGMTSVGVSSDVVATQLVFAVQPGGSVSGQALTTQPVVAAQDGDGVVDVNFAETVTLTTGASGSLTSQSVSAVLGVATFTSVAYTEAADGETFSLTADDVAGGTEGDLPAVTSVGVSSDVVATQLVFAVQPAGSVSGQVLTTQPVVVAQNGSGQVDVNFAEMVTLTTGAPGSLTGQSVLAVLGVATFTNLTYRAVTDGETFTLTADDQAGGAEGDLPAVTSVGVSSDVVATQLVFAVQPGGSVSGQALTTQPVVVAQNGSGQVDVNFAETVTLTTGASGSLTGRSVSAVLGVATFTSVAYTEAADGETFSLTADDVAGGTEGDLPAVTSVGVSSDVVATQLVFAVQPAGSVSGQVLTTQPVVVAQNGSGQVDVNFAEMVTLTTGAPGSLTGQSVLAVLGVATFTNLTYRAVTDGETFTLTADDQAGGAEGDLPAVTSVGVSSDVVATQLVFAVQPGGSVSGQALTTQPVVVAQNGSGQVDVNFAETVTLTTGASGSLTGRSVSAVLGVATFTSVAYTEAADGETFSLTADDVAGGTEGDLPAVTSVGVSSDVVATQLVFAVQPAGSVSGQVLTTQPVVVAQNGSGQVDVNFAETVTLTTGAPGSLTGQSVLAVLGVATFTNLTYRAVTDGETFTLTADDQAGGAEGDLPAVTSVGVSSDVVATQLVFAVQPGGSVSGQALTTQPVVVAQNGSGQVDVNFAETVTLTTGASGSLTGRSVSAVLGVATFTSVAYTEAADGETFSLTADDQAGGVEGDLPAVTSVGVSSDVVATQLVFAVQPAGSVSGQVLTTQPVVVAQNGSGQVDVNFAETVTLTTGAPGSLTGQSVLAVLGVATFTNLTYRAVTDGETFTLTADDQAGGAEGDLPAVTSVGVSSDVVATQLVFAVQPGGSVSGQALTTQPVVVAQNGSGQVDVNFAETVTLTTGASGSLTGRSVSAVLGVATFTSVAYTEAADGETFSLTADDQAGGVEGDLPAVTSAEVSSDVVATQLVFAVQPAGSVSGQVLTTQPVVVAQNGSGQVDVNFAETVTLTTGAPGSLTGQSVLAVLGVATFTNLTYRAVTDGETFTLTADDQAGGAEGDLPAVTSVGVSSDVVATQLVFAVQPGGSVSGQALTTQPVVVAQNGSGQVDVNFAETVTLTTGASGSLTGRSVSAVLGVATFTSVAYTEAADGETFSLTADDQAGGVEGDLPAVTSAEVSSDVVATQLVFAVQPAGSVSGQVLTTQPVVVAQNGSGQVDVNFAETVTLTTGAPGSLTGQSVLAVLGVATFTNLTYRAVTDGETFTLTADDQAGGAEGDLPAVTSVGVSSDVVATQLVFSVQPAGSVSGQALATQPVVVAQDGGGITDVNFMDKVTLATDAPGSLTNPTATAVSGIATFTNVTYMTTSGPEMFVLRADDEAGGAETDLPPVQSVSVTAEAPAPYQLVLVFNSDPIPADGASFKTISIMVLDTSQNIQFQDNSTVVTLTVDGAGVGGGTASVKGGRANFSVTSTTVPGVVTLNVASTDLAEVTSSFTTFAGEAHQLALIYDSTSLPSDGLSTRSVTVQVLDINGHLRTHDDTTRVTLAVTGPGSGGGQRDRIGRGEVVCCNSGFDAGDLAFECDI